MKERSESKTLPALSEAPCSQCRILRKALAKVYARELEEIFYMCESDPMYMEFFRPQLEQLANVVFANATGERRVSRPLDPDCWQLGNTRKTQ